MQPSRPQPPIARALSEPAAKKLKRSKHPKLSPLSLEYSSDKPSTVPTSGSDALPHPRHVASLDMTSTSIDNSDAAPLSKTIEEVIPVKSPLEEPEVKMNLFYSSGYPIPINIANTFVDLHLLQSGPLHVGRRSHRTLLPLYLAGSKVRLPAVAESGSSHRDMQNWLLKCLLSLHKHFQVV